jgi:hypothetical protein
MPHPLDGARAKIVRAEKHLAALEADVGEYLRTQPISVEQRDQREGERRRIVWIATATTQPPDELGLVVGDWAHNIRAALDYTVYELVRRETGDEDPRWTQFPIVITQARYAAQVRDRLRGAPAWALPVLEGLQPFNDGGEAAYHPFGILADVSNRDKHRLVHTAAMQIAGSQARLEGTSLLAIHGIGQNPGVVEDERVILDALIATTFKSRSTCSWRSHSRVTKFRSSR